MRDQRLRADARRNSERIIRAAIALFRDRGPAPSLEPVAERAGVGIATVHRPFGGREELVRAAFGTYVAEEVEPLAVAARARGLRRCLKGLTGPCVGQSVSDRASSYAAAVAVSRGYVRRAGMATKGAASSGMRKTA